MTNIFELNNLKNIKSSIYAQGVANATSVLILFLGLFYLNPSEYSEIQIIQAYIVFAGFMHLGFLDGLEIRIAGKIIEKDNFATLILIVTILSTLPSIFYVITFKENAKNVVLIALSAFPLINLNAFLTVLLRSYGYSWIASNGLILEKIVVAFYLIVTAVLAPDLMNYYLLGIIASIVYCKYKLKKIGINFEFGIHWGKLNYDLRHGLLLMLSNTLYSGLSVGLLIVSSKLHGVENVTKLAIAITFLNLFIGLSSQVSKVIFPLSVSKVNTTNGEYGEKNYQNFIEKTVPAILIVSMCGLYLFDASLKDYFKIHNILNYAYYIIPIAYFEIKNQIIHLNNIKMKRDYAGYITACSLSLVFASILICFISELRKNDFELFFVCMVTSFIIRFYILSVRCKTINFIDLIFLIVYILFLYMVI